MNLLHVLMGVGAFALLLVGAAMYCVRDTDGFGFSGNRGKKKEERWSAFEDSPKEARQSS